MKLGSLLLYCVLFSIMVAMEEKTPFSREEVIAYTPSWINIVLLQPGEESFTRSAREKDVWYTRMYSKYSNPKDNRSYLAEITTEPKHSIYFIDINKNLSSYGVVYDSKGNKTEKKKDPEEIIDSFTFSYEKKEPEPPPYVTPEQPNNNCAINFLIAVGKWLIE